MKRTKKVLATLMEMAARKTLESAADSRCMYVLHQPKQPDGVKKFKK